MIMYASRKCFPLPPPCDCIASRESIKRVERRNGRKGRDRSETGASSSELHWTVIKAENGTEKGTRLIFSHSAFSFCFPSPLPGAFGERGLLRGPGGWKDVSRWFGSFLFEHALESSLPIAVTVIFSIPHSRRTLAHPETQRSNDSHISFRSFL